MALVHRPGQDRFFFRRRRPAMQCNSGPWHAKLINLV
jgi:hypothetical protein